jgi:hypothetical protein
VDEASTTGPATGREGRATVSPPASSG